MDSIRAKLMVGSLEEVRGSFESRFPDLSVVATFQDHIVAYHRPTGEYRKVCRVAGIWNESFEVLHRDTYSQERRDVRALAETAVEGVLSGNGADDVLDQLIARVLSGTRISLRSMGESLEYGFTAPNPWRDYFRENESAVRRVLGREVAPVVANTLRERFGDSGAGRHEDVGRALTGLVVWLEDVSKRVTALKVPQGGLDVGLARDMADLETLRSSLATELSGVVYTVRGVEVSEANAADAAWIYDLVAGETEAISLMAAFLNRAVQVARL